MNIAMTFPDTVDEFMEQYKMTDTECVYSNGIEYVPIFRMEQWFEHLEAKPKTNADRIRSMTDEELAEWLNDMQGYSFSCGLIEARISEYPNHYKAWREWLKEEVKE